jgi:nucleolar protein 4
MATAPRTKRQRTDENGDSIAVVAHDTEETPLSHAKNRQPIKADSKDPRSLFVRNLAPSTTSDILTEHFSQSYPIKHAVAVLEKSTQQCKGFGFVTYADPEDADRALVELNGSELEGRKLKVEMAQSRQREEESKTGDKRPARGGNNQEDIQPAPKLIVRNLPWSIKDADQLAHLFRSFGKIKQAILPKNKAGRLMGFGIILIRGKGNAEKAIAAMNGKDVDGRTLAVDWAVDRDTWEKAKDDGKEVDVTKDDENEDENDRDEDAAGHLDDDDDDESMEDIDEDDEDDDLLDEEPLKRDTNDTSIFIRNLPFNCNDEDLGDHFSQFGPIRFARVVYDPTTGRSKGTGFVCFAQGKDVDACIRGAPRMQIQTPAKNVKGSGEIVPHSVLQDDSVDASGKYTMDGRVLICSKAVDKNEAKRLRDEGVETRSVRDKDKRRLYLLSEGTIPSNSPLYQKLSPSEISMREGSTKQRKTLIESNPSLHLSLTRLSIRNIPRSITSKDLKALARQAVVGFATDVKDGKRQALSKEELSRHAEEMREAEKERKVRGKGVVRQAKVVFESKEGKKVPELEGAGRSRGYGFIEYYTHRSALMGLRWLNGHSVDYQAIGAAKKGGKVDIEDKKRRLIAEFAIENAQVVHRRSDRETKMRERRDDDKTAKTADDASEEVSSRANPKWGRKPKFEHKIKQQGTAVGKRERPDPSANTQPQQDDGGKLAKRNRIISKKRMARRTRKGE